MNNISNPNVLLGMRFVNYHIGERLHDLVGEEDYRANLAAVALTGSADSYISHCRDSRRTTSRRLGEPARAAMMYDARDDLIAELGSSNTLKAHAFLATQTASFAKNKPPSFFQSSERASAFHEIGAALNKVVNFDERPDAAATKAAKRLADEFISKHIDEVKDELAAGKLGGKAKGAA